MTIANAIAWQLRMHCNLKARHRASRSFLAVFGQFCYIVELLNHLVNFRTFPHPYKIRGGIGEMSVVVRPSSADGPNSYFSRETAKRAERFSTFSRLIFLRWGGKVTSVSRIWGPNYTNFWENIHPSSMHACIIYESRQVRCLVF